MQRVLRWDCCYIADNSTSYSGCSPDWHPKGCCSTSVRSSCFLKQDLPVLVGLQNASILTCGRLASAILEQVLKFGCSLSRPPVSYTYGAECFGRFISLPKGRAFYWCCSLFERMPATKSCHAHYITLGTSFVLRL